MWAGQSRAFTPTSTYLAQQAALLSAGQCIKLTHNATSTFLSPGGSDIVQWGMSMAYVPQLKQIHYVGKESGPVGFHWLIYDEITAQFTMQVPSWSGGSDAGHGFDHNTADPVNGIFYHVPYNSNVVRAWQGGTWSSLSAWTQNTTATGGLSWTPFGLFYNDGIQGLLQWNGSTWTTISGVAITGSYHDFSEYNSTANVLIFGGGNGSAYYKCTSGLSVSTITGPSGWTITSSPSAGGLCVADPSSTKMIGRDGVTGNWYQYDISNDGAGWTSLTQSVGSGSSPQSGLPPLAVDTSNEPLCCALPQYNCIAFFQHRPSGSTLADFWLYRHT